MSNPLTGFEYPQSVPQEVRQRFSAMQQVFSPEEVQRAIDQLAVRLTVALQDRNPVFITVLHGGLVFAGQVLNRAIFPCRTGYVHVTRYGAGTQGGELTWHAQSHPDLQGETVVFLDDILDQGKTLTALNAWAEQHGAADVRNAVLVNRLHVPQSVQADFAALETGPGFLVGSGMDLAGYGRNLPGIYQLSDEGQE